MFVFYIWKGRLFSAASVLFPTTRIGILASIVEVDDWDEAAVKDNHAKCKEYITMVRELIV